MEIPERKSGVTARLPQPAALLVEREARAAVVVGVVRQLPVSLRPPVRLRPPARLKAADKLPRRVAPERFRQRLARRTARRRQHRAPAVAEVVGLPRRAGSPIGPAMACIPHEFLSWLGSGCLH